MQALLLVAGLAFASPRAERQVDALFSRYTAATPGVSVAVVQEGKVVLLKGYGSAHLEQGRLVTPETVFQVGSVSKQFTAFAIYLLEKQGRLALEDDVRKFVPELPEFGAPIRIRHLLAHTSGLRDQHALRTLAGWRMDDVATTGQVLAMLTRQRELNFAPGSAYLYCNSGYTLLGEIVKRASGRSLAEFARQEIFVPLGMKSTRFVDDYEAVIPRRAESYYLSQGRYLRVALNDAVPGPSNVYTTAGDLAKWALNFEKPVVGDGPLLERFNEPSRLDNGERAVYYSSPGDVGYHAKGQVVRTYRGLPVLSHGGHAGGYRSTLWRFPAQRFAVILLSNDEHFAQLANAEAMVGFYLGKQLAAAPAVAGAASPVASAAAVRPVLDGLSGRYYSEELDTAYTARVAEGKLVLSHLRHGDIALTPAGAGAFTGRIEFPCEFEFRREGGGAAGELWISNFGAKKVRFRRSAGPG